MKFASCAVLFGCLSLFSFSPEKILSELTLREKIGQMILVYHSPAKFLKKHKIGGVLIMGNMITPKLELKKELHSLQKSLPIPLLVTIDQEGGKINRLAALPEYSNAPSATALSSQKDEAIQKQAAHVTGFLKTIGVNTNLAPCVDPALSFEGAPTFMKIRERSFGSNPDSIIQKAGAFINGIQTQNGLCILKHFPGYDVDNNSDEHISISRAGLSNLKTYLEPFRVLCPKADGIMMNNIIYTQIDSFPAVLSPKIVAMGRALCGEKIIVTDDLWAVSLRSFVYPGKKIYRTKYPDKRFKRIVKMAFLAGSDVLMITFPKKVPLMIDTIHSLAKKDKKYLKQINQSVTRILNLKKRIAGKI